MDVWEKDDIDMIPVDFSEKTDILNKLSDEILIDNIHNQVDEVMIDSLVKNNILDIFNERYNFIRNYYREHKEILNKCKIIKDDIYEELLNDISEKFNFFSNLDTIKGTDDYYDYVESLYEFFILDYRDNLTIMLKNYILSNRTSLIDEFKKYSDKDDLMFKALLKTFTDDSNIHIMYNLEDIINTFINSNPNYEYILEYIIQENRHKFSNNLVNELFSLDHRCYITVDVDFTSLFMRPLRMDKYKYTILTSVRNDLVKNFIKGDE